MNYSDFKKIENGGSRPPASFTRRLSEEEREKFVTDYATVGFVTDKIKREQLEQWFVKVDYLVHGSLMDHEIRELRAEIRVMEDYMGLLP